MDMMLGATPITQKQPVVTRLGLAQVELVKFVP